MVYLHAIADRFYSYIIPLPLFGSLSYSIDESRALISDKYQGVNASELPVKMVSMFNRRGTYYQSFRYIESIEYHGRLLGLWQAFVASRDDDVHRGLSLNALRDELCRGVVLDRDGVYEPNRQYLLPQEDQKKFSALCYQETERRSMIVADDGMPSAIAIDVRPLQRFMQEKLGVQMKDTSNAAQELSDCSSQ